MPALLSGQTAKVRWDVRFGSKADICSAKSHVRFTPGSGHEMAIRDLWNLMSALGSKMSALTPKADIQQREWNVR